MKKRAKPQRKIESGPEYQGLFTFLLRDKAKTYCARILLSLTLLIIAKGLAILIPFIYSYIVDYFNHQDAVLTLPLFLIIGYGVVKVLSESFSQLRDLIFAKVGQSTAYTIATTAVKKLYQLSYAFHLNKKTGGIARDIDRGVQSIEIIFYTLLFVFIPSLFEIIAVCIIFLLKFQPILGVTVAIGIASYIYFSIVYTKKIVSAQRNANVADSQANERLVDGLSNIASIKYFTSEGREISYYESCMAKFRQANIVLHKHRSFLGIGQSLIISLTLVAVMLISGQELIAKEISIGEFVLIMTLIAQIFAPLTYAGYFYSEFKAALSKVEKLFSLLHVDDIIREKQGAADLDVPHGQIVFKNIHFSYPDKNKVFSGLSLTIQPQRRTAIVGLSGSGKSTLINLLFRFFDVDKGDIEIDGQNIKHITKLSLRSSIGFVPQSISLFNNTLRYNLVYGKPNASMKEIESALEATELLDLVAKLPKGLDTDVGEHGQKLSGGERQRIAIARMLIAGANIQVFDEATSSLDMETERKIKKTIDRASKNKTSIIIAHRLETIKNADTIVVLKDGEIVQEGSHDELINQAGEYRRLWDDSSNDEYR